MATFTKKDLLEAMRIDHAHRYRGVKDGLVTLYEMEKTYQMRRWDFSLPTIGFKDRLITNWTPKDGHDRVKHFVKRIQNDPTVSCIYEYILSGAFVLAGGMLSHILRTDERYLHDIHERDFDLFVVNKTESHAEECIKNMFLELKKIDDKFEMYVNPNCVTIVNPVTRMCVQIILRSYSTISEVIHGFDIGAAQVAWDGLDVYMTSMGRVAYEQGVIVLNLTKRRGTYEARLQKYFNCGFNVVLPNLRIPNRKDACALLGITNEDIATATEEACVKATLEDSDEDEGVDVAVKINKRLYEIKLPNLVLEGYTHSSSISLAKWDIPRECFCGGCENCHDSDFGKDLTRETFISRCSIVGLYKRGEENSDYGGLHYYDSKSISAVNFKKLLIGDNTEFMYYRSLDGDVRDSYLEYDEKKIQEYLKSYLKYKIVKGNLNPRILFKVIPTLESWKSEVMNVLLDLFDLGTSTTRLSDDAKISSIDTIISLAINKARIAYDKKFYDGDAKMKIQWKGVEDGTTLINPFKMEMMSESEWYGEWYAKEKDRVSYMDMFGIPDPFATPSAASTPTTSTPTTSTANMIVEKSVETTKVTSIEDMTDQIFELLKPKIDAYIRDKFSK